MYHRNDGIQHYGGSPMLDYKDLIIKHYGGGISARELAAMNLGSKSGISDFLRSFEKCSKLSYPLPEGITNYGIAELVYGSTPASHNSGRNESFEQPDYSEVHNAISSRKNMTLQYLWNQYKRTCDEKGVKPYSYRQFCANYSSWCDENQETLHYQAVIADKMEVDFAGDTFILTDKITGESSTIVVFVAVLPYSQYIYAEGMLSTREPQWIAVNNHALEFFGGVAHLVVCDNCKQAVTVNNDWIEPVLNKDYAEWAEHNNTVIMPAKVRKPKMKSSVENAVGILEKGIFHTLRARQYFSLDQFNRDLLHEVDELNHNGFEKKPHSRYYYWEEEREELLPLPAVPYEYTERRIVKVSPDYHVRFDNAYYSVDKAYLHKQVVIAATDKTIRISSLQGTLLVEWPRAKSKGQWSTDPSHLPAHFREMTEWNAGTFISKAMTIGPNTTEVIRRVLKSRPIEVQTYRMCQGILSFTRKYSKEALEECCGRALESGKTTYTTIKNTLPAFAEQLGKDGYNTHANEEKNRGAFVMGSAASDIETLLNRSMNLAAGRKDGER